jgi:hypothetical protein
MAPDRISALQQVLEQAFQNVPKPPNAKSSKRDLSSVAVDLALMTEEYERWYLPQLMIDSLNHILQNDFPIVEIEHILFAFDPEGILKFRQADLTEKILYEQRVNFLNGFDSQQRNAIIKWIEFISSFQEAKGYFRFIKRIAARFSLPPVGK